MSDLVKRLRGRRISWVGAGMDPDPDCSKAADRIEELERDLRVYMDAAEGHMVERLRAIDELSAEKALADRLYNEHYGGDWYEAAEAYRKARGL